MLLAGRFSYPQLPQLQRLLEHVLPSHGRHDQQKQRSEPTAAVAATRPKAGILVSKLRVVRKAFQIRLESEKPKNAV